jgi:hypothetical protein
MSRSGTFTYEIAAPCSAATAIALLGARIARRLTELA